MELDGGPVDFLVITGDVAQGRSSAGDLERNYDCAAEVIRSLAFHIWSEDDGGKFLRQDWKRRTIIIPGNHDYASMNELETQHGESHRASAGGRPAAKEGSAMAKFTYYINFVRRHPELHLAEKAICMHRSRGVGRRSPGNIISDMFLTSAQTSSWFGASVLFA